MNALVEGEIAAAPRQIEGLDIDRGLLGSPPPRRFIGSSGACRLFRMKKIKEKKKKK